MAQYIHQAPLGGRLGSGIGQGLADQLPKEMDRYRLSQGLKAFEQDSGSLNPMQQLARLSSIPGITPQMVQSFSDLARQQGMAKSLTNQSQREEIPMQKGSQFFGNQTPTSSVQPKEIPTITNKEFQALAQKGYVPPSQQERDAMASKLFEQNPGRYKNDPQNALDAVDRSVAIEGERYKTAADVVGSQQKMQENVKNKLKEQSQALNTKIPDDVYSSIEDEAIRATLPTSEGGRGLSADQAMKEYGKRVDNVSREYSAANTLGGWSIVGGAEEAARVIKNIQKQFSDRNDTENLAKILIEKEISPMRSYAMAQPVHENSSLNKVVKSLPRISLGSVSRLQPSGAFDLEKTTASDISKKTLEAAPRLMEAMGKEGSPLAVAYELKNKGYDPSVWLDYLSSHQKEWDPTIRQNGQLGIKNPVFEGLNDWWLSSFTGIK